MIIRYTYYILHIVIYMIIYIHICIICADTQGIGKYPTQSSEVQLASERNIDQVLSEFREYASEVPRGRALIQWVDLRENLQETIDVPMKYGIFL